MANVSFRKVAEDVKAEEMQRWGNDKVFTPVTNDFMQASIQADRNEAKAIKDNEWLRPGETYDIHGQPYDIEGADKAQRIVESIGSWIPGMGTAIAAKDYANAIENNDTVGGVLAAAQLIPVFGGGAKLGTTFLRGPSNYMLKQMGRGNDIQKVMKKAIKHGNKVSIGANIIGTGNDIKNTWVNE